MKLIVDSRFPSRRGNFVQKDITSDVTFLRKVDASWNLQEDLGSNHFTIEIKVRITPTPPKTYT